MTETLITLQAENARLIALLETHGIEWRLPPEPTPPAFPMGGSSKFSAADKIALIRRLFRSLSRQGEVNPLVEHYGNVIVDECHHVGAVLFDAILKRTKRLAGDGLSDRRTSDSRTRPPRGTEQHFFCTADAVTLALLLTVRD
ncbi:hypothetical protein [Thiocapsa roseopersicina]|uniref:hypothetical protein n=1 Tax=Thiocapsa roseopersicina TaxID=1058 RepID=UPI001C317C27|nr:hypothetical protein [Thiocapsa roseopersicina]